MVITWFSEDYFRYRAAESAVARYRVRFRLGQTIWVHSLLPAITKSMWTSKPAGSCRFKCGGGGARTNCLENRTFVARRGVSSCRRCRFVFVDMLVDFALRRVTAVVPGDTYSNDA